MYVELKDSKKLIEKLRKLCSAASKFNINSPCLLQFIRLSNGELNFILSHDPKNGDINGFYHILSYTIEEYDKEDLNIDEIKSLEPPDERLSVPFVISSCKLIDQERLTIEEINKKYKELQYSYGINSYYVYPKFILDAIKADYINCFEIQMEEFDGQNNLFSINISTKSNDLYNYITFIQNKPNIDKYYNLNVFPLHIDNKNNMNIKQIYLKTNNSFLIIDKEMWEQTFEINKFNLFATVKGFNNYDFLIYHNDFVPKKIQNGFLSQKYMPEGSNKVHLMLNIELNHNIFEYFSYRYFDFKVS